MSNSKKEKHSPLRVCRNTAFLLKYVVKYTPGYLFVDLCEAVGRGIWHILGVLFLKYVFDAIESGVAFEEIFFWCCICAAYRLGFEIFNKWRWEVYVPQVSLTLHEKIQGELYQKARSLDQRCYDDPDFYNDFVWAIRESDTRVVQIMEDLSIFFNRVISSVAILGALVFMDWIVGVVLMAAVILNFMLDAKMNTHRFQFREELMVIDRKLSYVGRLFYMPDYAKDLRQGGASDHMRRLFQQNADLKVTRLKQYFRKFSILIILSELLVSSVPTAGITGYLVIRYIVDPALSLGTFGAGMEASFSLFWTIRDMSRYLTKFHENSLYIEKFQKFLAYEPQIKGEQRDVPAFESLTLKDLSFGYGFSEEEKLVLSGIDLEIKKGEKIAFVGYNGAGKTTLIKLLMRLYDPTDGQILYNGTDIRSFDPEAYREHIGAVFQDYRIFAATLAENVLGDEYTDGQAQTVLQALDAASFGDKLESLPQGLESQLTTEFSKDGVGLSGGEAQKVAIARIFARPFELVIMDEPSSALDPIAEYELNQAISSYAADRTVIFISHRLSTTRMADRIYMFCDGKIAECGSHHELMRQNGKYAEMYRVQAKKYRDACFAQPI